MLPGLSRKNFLIGTAALAASSWLPRLSQADAAALRMTEVAPGLFVHQGVHAVFSPANAGDISNLSLIVGRDAAAVVDTGGSAMIGRGFLAAIRAITDKPIRYVINTHMHPDHVFGNAPFVGEKPIFVAHHKMARGLSARAERYLTVNKVSLGDAAFEGTTIVMPNEHVKEPRDIDLGERIITLVPRATAHTDNDMTVFDRATGTLIMGDLLFSEHIPTLDGSIAGWIKLIGEMKSEAAERVVPGHGPASMAWPDALVPIERYLRRIADDVRSMIKSERTLSDAIMSAGASEKDQWLLASEFHARNVTAAFAELEWE
ncbi:MAG: quinoprotein relay system zinc metallohydrolase 2 [Hyphomicrobium sp.]